MEKNPTTNLILHNDGSIYHLGLRPEDFADTIITVGDPDRVSKVSQYFDRIEFRQKHREFITHTGWIGKKKISVISTGMGVSSIEIFFNEIDALANTNLVSGERLVTKKILYIIRIGTSGSINKELAVDSELIADYAVGLDTILNFYVLPQSTWEANLAQNLQNKTGLPYRPYVAQGSTYLYNLIGKGISGGHTITCPGFYAPQGRTIGLALRFPHLLHDLISYEYENFKPTNLEMETSGYYAFGKLFGHEVTSVNAILANRITGEFSKNPDKTIHQLIMKVLSAVVDEKK